MSVTARYDYKRHRGLERWERRPRGLPFIFDETGWCYQTTPWTNARRLQRVPEPHLPAPLQLWRVWRHRRQPFYVLFDPVAETWEVHAGWRAFEGASP